ncbi:OmpH family outer membrane protein [Chitinophaga vietnamensis]|uniref:OmpH family outer membrane protein n=1 Tax=Chitinophaga vietnamensis TaxID=2593957 RepID=UPI001375C07B|nr:OmpH family outer membrane protein [Chitinophaga vietnamensis]
MKFICTCLLSLFLGASAFAQSKTAYINFQQLVAQMPETKNATASLQQYQSGLSKDGQQLVAEYTRMAQEFDSLPKNTSQAVRELKVKSLQTAQANIQEYRGRMEEKMAAKEQELLKPIVDKAKTALKAVAKEKGYSLVIDNSRDAVLIAEETDDLMAAAKAKLGIK